MTDLYSLVCQTAAKLQAEGKTPSLALVRAHAGRGLDTAALFSAYQQWRTNQSQAESTPQAESPTQTGATANEPESEKDKERMELRREISLLHAKIDRLTSLVEQLSSQSGSPDVRR